MRADRQDGDQALADADQHVHADHRGRRACRARGRRCRRRRRARRTPARPPGPRPARRCPPARRRPATACLGSTGLEQLEDDPADDDGGQRPSGDVGAERGDPAVGEEQRTGPAARRSRRATPVHGPTRIAASAPPIRWPLVPDADREVEHLHREDERRDQAGHRRGAVVELAAGADEGDSHARNGGDRAVTTDVGASRNPSGTCMRVPPGLVGRLARSVGLRCPPYGYCMLFATSAPIGLEDHPVSETERLSPGDTAPDFTLPADTGDATSPSATCAGGR